MFQLLTFSNFDLFSFQHFRCYDFSEHLRHFSQISAQCVPITPNLKVDSRIFPRFIKFAGIWKYCGDKFDLEKYWLFRPYLHTTPTRGHNFRSAYSRRRCPASQFHLCRNERSSNRVSHFHLILHQDLKWIKSAHQALAYLRDKIWTISFS